MSSEGVYPEIKAAVAGAIVLGFGTVGYWAKGSLYSMAEARDLIEALTGSALYLGSAMTAGSGTILALMLTLVGLVKRVDSDFDAPVYKRISRVSQLAVYSFIGSVSLLLVLTMPVGEFDNVPPQWYPGLYNLLYAMVIGLSALLVATVVLLYETIITIIVNVTPGDDV